MFESLEWCEACTTLGHKPRRGQPHLFYGADVRLCGPCVKALIADGEVVEPIEVAW